MPSDDNLELLSYLFGSDMLILTFSDIFGYFFSGKHSVDKKTPNFK